MWKKAGRGKQRPGGRNSRVREAGDYNPLESHLTPLQQFTTQLAFVTDCVTITQRILKHYKIIRYCVRHQDN